MTSPTIVLFPDTQYMVETYPLVWEGMTQWVADNLITKNIVAVIGLGDVTDTHTDAEYAEALVGWNQINTLGIPYIPIIGNHDYDNVNTRNSAKWKASFPISRFSSKSWFGGSYSGTTENYWLKFKCGAAKYLVIGLEIFPRTAVLNWAQQVINQHDDYEIIINTHGYMKCDGSLILHADIYGPDFYGLNADNDGQEIWSKLIKGNPHIIMVVNGHYIAIPTSARRLNFGGCGNQVEQFFINHQEDDNGGNGWMGLLTLQPEIGQIDVKTYSAYLDDFDPTGAYTLYCRIERKVVEVYAI